MTLGGLDPAHDDTTWAKQAAAGLGGVEHLMLDPAQLPPEHADISAAGDGQDTPFARVRNATRDAHLARLLVERGARLHLAGHGGDEVLQAPSAYLHTTLWAHPRGAAPRAWAGGPRCGPRPGPPRTRSTPPQPCCAKQRPAPHRSRPPVANPPPCSRYAPARISHATSARSWPAPGLPLALPYFDDRVVEACLAVRLHDKWVMESCVGLEDPDRAGASGVAALYEAKTHGVGVIVGQIGKARRTFPKPWETLRPVIELDERLALAS